MFSYLIEEIFVTGWMVYLEELVKYVLLCNDQFMVTSISLVLTDELICVEQFIIILVPSNREPLFIGISANEMSASGTVNEIINK